MAKKHMKKCSPSLAIKEMQIKTTLRFHLTPVTIIIIKNTTSNCCWEDVGKEEPSYTASECKVVQPLWKTIWRLLKNLNIDLPYHLAISLLGYTQRNATQATPEAPAHSCLLQGYSP
jgi:hypothetical protein